MLEALFSLALLCSTGFGSSNSTIAKQRVDLIELNHFLDDTGRHVFDQLVFYEWNPDRSAYRVIAWRMVKRSGQLPQRTWHPPGYLCIWQDEGVMREIWAPAFRETWTQSDPERENRKTFSENRRPELAVPRGIHAAKMRESLLR
jgi:hypothetical protein